jgi:hypothetical protein
VGVIAYLAYYAVFTTVFGRDDLSDKLFHLRQSQHPLTFSEGYYAPLLHFIVYPLTFVLPVQLAMSLVVPFILFILLPLAFIFAWSSFDYCNSRVSDATFYIFFVSYMIPFCMLNCTWAQALNMVFVLVSLGIMFLNLNLRGVWKGDGLDKCLIVFVALGVFSHTAGGLWLVAIFFIYLLLLRAWGMIALSVGLFLFMLYIHPPIVLRPLSVILATSKNFPLNPWELIRICVFWFNPLALLVIWKGFRLRRTLEPTSPAPLKKLPLQTTDVLLLASIILALLTGVMDSELRSLLSASVLFGLYGVYGLRNSKLKPFFCIWQIFWIILLSFGVVVSHTL